MLEYPVGYVLIGIVIMALVARGFAFAASEGQIFGAYGEFLKSLPKWAAKPLGQCGHCSVTTWGTLALIAVGMFPWGIYALWLLPVYWLGATGLQDLIDP